MTAANPVPDAGKLYIAAQDSDAEVKDIKVIAQYNPKELTVDRKVPWSKHSYANKGTDQAKDGRGHIAYEFTGAEGRTMSVELLFDAFGDPKRTVDVMQCVRDLEKLAAVKHPTSANEDERRPPLCLVVWGEELFKTQRFTCVITQLTTKYLMFDAKGKPLRAQCTVVLQEADLLSTKDAEHKDPDANAGPNAGGHPAPSSTANSSSGH